MKCVTFDCKNKNEYKFVNSFFRNEETGICTSCRNRLIREGAYVIDDFEPITTGEYACDACLAENKLSFTEYKGVSLCEDCILEVINPD